MKNTGILRPIVVFFILSSIVFVACAILLYSNYAVLENKKSISVDKYREHLKEQLTEITESGEKKYPSAEEVEAYLLTTRGYQMIMDEHREGSAFLAGLGGVFLLLLGGGCFFLYRSVRQQHLLNVQQQNFLQTISHEMKTPIGSIMSSLSNIQNYDLERQMETKMVGNAMTSARRLDGLVHKILTAAKLDNNSMTYVIEETDLSMLTNEVVRRFKARIDGSRLVSSNVEEDLLVQGDSSALISIVSNLLDNAHKYSDKGSQIQLRLLESKKNKIRLEISDNGVGIPDEHKDEIFKRFYRVGAEETRSTKGSGLGLFIVKKLVEMHKGSIKVEDNHPQGSTFIVEMPGIKFVPAYEGEFSDELA